MSLTGKVFLITGASKGIGRATAERVAADGASVVINYLSDSKAADEVVSKIGADRALAVQADVSQLADIEKLVAAAVDKFGKIDVVIPNAAVMRMHDLAHTTPADYDDHFNLNVKGPLFLIQAAVPHIPPNSGGRIILISTGLTSVATVQPGHLLYAATKGAVEQMVRTLSKELAPRGITVNAVAPGPTATELFFNGKTEGLVDAMKKQSPFGRLGDPTEIAGVLTFLAGGESSWVSGQTVRVNGANMV